MSRSRRHAPIRGLCSYGSEKFYKRKRAKQERARTRLSITLGKFDEALHEQSPWDEWSTNRDGKVYLPSLRSGMAPSMLRK